MFVKLNIHLCKEKKKTKQKLNSHPTVFSIKSCLNNLWKGSKMCSFAQGKQQRWHRFKQMHSLLSKCGLKYDAENNGWEGGITPEKAKSHRCLQTLLCCASCASCECNRSDGSMLRYRTLAAPGGQRPSLVEVRLGSDVNPTADRIQ